MLFISEGNERLNTRYAGLDHYTVVSPLGTGCRAKVNLKEMRHASKILVTELHYTVFLRQQAGYGIKSTKRSSKLWSITYRFRLLNDMPKDY